MFPLIINVFSSMKNKFRYSLTAALIVYLLCSADISAQKIEIIPFAGYQTSAKIPSVKGDFRLNDGMNFGLALDLGSPDAGYKFFLSYSRQGSFLELDSADINTTICDLAVHNISIGAMIELFQGDMVIPFSKLGFGSTIYQPLDSDIGNERVMHFILAGGAKLYLNDHFGFRFQAGLYLPLFFEGYLFEEGAPPPGEGVKTKIAGVHGDFTAGLIARF
jgi:hypothetical protein